MRHQQDMNVALAERLSLEEAQRRRAIDQHDRAMARLAAKGWTE